MSKFKVGDKVKRVGHTWLLAGQGEIYTVSWTDDWAISLEEIPGRDYDPDFFELMKEGIKYPNPPHKHAELIKAWADGAVIEQFCDGITCWMQCWNPLWKENSTYRIKPSKTEQELQLEKLEATVRDTLAQIEEIKKGK
jgi:hypothetical protein